MPYSPPSIPPASTASPAVVEVESPRSVATRPLVFSKSTDSFEKLRSNAKVIHIETRRLTPQVQRPQRHRARRRSAGWPLTNKEPPACKGSSKQHSELVIQLTKKSLAFSAVLLRQEVNPLRSKPARPKRSNTPLLPHVANLPLRPKPRNTQILSEHPDRETFAGSIQKSAPSLLQSKDDLQKMQPHSSETQDGGEWRSQRALLQKELERLYFWSSNFSDEELEIILGEQSDLKNSILESLSSIGQSLIDALQPGLDVDPRLRQPRRDLDELVRKCKILKVESYDGDDTASETSDISSASASDGEQSRSLLEKLRADIDRLQGHVRVMRRVLDFTESQSGVEEAPLSPKRVRFQLSDTRPSSPRGEKKGYSDGSIDSFLRSSSPATEYMGIRDTYRDTARSRQPGGTTFPRAKSTNSLDSPRLPFGDAVPVAHDGLSKRKRSTPSSGRPCVRCSEKEKPCDGEDTCTPCQIACVRCIREARDLALWQRPDNQPLIKDCRPIPLDKVRTASLQEMWDHLETLPGLSKLTAETGKRVVLRVSTSPGNPQALESKPILDSPSSDPRPSLPVVDALDMLCEDLDTKLRIDDTGLPADVTTKFLTLVPELPPSSSNRDARGNETLKRSPLLDLLHPITSILALLECLPDWTIHTTASELPLARTVLSFAYGCFVKQLLAASDKLSKEILARMMNKVGHNEEVRYAIGNYFFCIEHLSRLEAGIKLNEIWDELQPRLRDILSILSSLFDETRETLRSKKIPGPPTSILRSSPKKKQVWSSSPHTPDMLDSEMDLSTFIVEFVPEVPQLPPFHLACYLTDQDRTSLHLGALDPSRPLGDLKALSARRLLTEATSDAESTLTKVVQPATDLRVRDESLRDTTTPLRASARAARTRDLPMPTQTTPTVISPELPSAIRGDISGAFADQVLQIIEAQIGVRLLEPETREITMQSPLPPQPTTAEDIPDDIADLEDRDAADLRAIQRSNSDVAMDRDLLALPALRYDSDVVMDRELPATRRSDSVMEMESQLSQ